jgi:hypothetical protein
MSLSLYISYIRNRSIIGNIDNVGQSRVNMELKEIPLNPNHL